MEWSPDGRWILVKTSGGMALVSVANGAIREIHSFEERVFTNWAPVFAGWEADCLRRSTFSRGVFRRHFPLLA
jgi:hypothetical protein